MGTSETRLATRAMACLLDHPDDTALADLFWQYQRVRAQMYAHLIEEPGTSGLDWFSRHFQRISPLRGALEASKYEEALRVQSQGIRLTALEARTSPAREWTGVRDEVRALASQARRHLAWAKAEGGPAPEVGLILHFVKRGPAERGHRANADPSHDRDGMRFAQWYRGRLREAYAIARALRWRPELLAVLRGIDVASKEIATPTWVLAPLFEVVRDASERASRVLAVTRPRWHVPPLRVTVHAGEDYRRLMEGLRRMHECVEAGLLRTGDRVGHGLALGLDIERYAKGSPVVLQPAEERLDDLLWELDRYRAGDCDAGSARSEFVRAEISKIARFVYDASYSVEDLVTSRSLRHRPRELARLGYPRLDPRVDASEKEPARRILFRYLHDPAVYARGQRQVEVEVKGGEVRALAEAQGFLQRTLSRLEVTVECNPTSNLLIGDLGDLRDHPAFRLVPTDRATPSFGVPVSINTDNPVTFGSCLGDEFALLYHAMLARGEGSVATLAWIDAARRAGLRSRFTLPASAIDAVLDEIARPYLPRVRSEDDRAISSSPITR